MALGPRIFLPCNHSGAFILHSYPVYIPTQLYPTPGYIPEFCKNKWSSKNERSFLCRLYPISDISLSPKSFITEYNNPNPFISPKLHYLLKKGISKAEQISRNSIGQIYMAPNLG